MISFNNPFQRASSLPPTQVAQHGLKSVNLGETAETKHDIADGYLKTIGAGGKTDEAKFARTVRAAAGQVKTDYQKAALEEAGLKMLAAGISGPVGLAMAQFGKEAFSYVSQSPRGDGLTANATAAKVLSAIADEAPNANAGLIAEVGSKIAKRDETANPVILKTFDAVLQSDSQQKPETALANYGLSVSKHGYVESDNAKVTGPVLDYLIANSSSESVSEQAKLSRMAGKAGDGANAAEQHREAFRDVLKNP